MNDDDIGLLLCVCDFLLNWYQYINCLFCAVVLVNYSVLTERVGCVKFAVWIHRRVADRSRWTARLVKTCNLASSRF